MAKVISSKKFNFITGNPSHWLNNVCRNGFVPPDKAPPPNGSSGRVLSLREAVWAAVAIEFAKAGCNAALTRGWINQMYVSGIVVGNVKHVFISPLGASAWRIDDLNAPDKYKINGEFQPLEMMAAFVATGQPIIYIPVGAICHRIREAFLYDCGPTPSGWVGDRLRGEAQP